MQDVYANGCTVNGTVHSGGTSQATSPTPSASITTPQTVTDPILAQDPIPMEMDVEGLPAATGGGDGDID